MARAGISGIGLVSALGNNAEETVKNLFAVSPRLPQQPVRIKTDLKKPVFELKTDSVRRVPLSFLLTALEEALSQAKLTPGILKTKRVGIAIGTTVACQLDNIPFYEQLRAGTTPENGQPLLDYIEGIPAEFLRNHLGVTGPAVTISNACASGADAAMLGLNWIKTGKCDLVITGGCDSVSKVAYNGFNALRVCSDLPCMPFDAERSGLNLGDGAGIVILEDPDSAAERGIRTDFLLAGAGKTADAFHITQPEGSGTELENAIRTALAEAGITEIDFANAHGTGTLVNDRVESAVLKRIFGSDLHFHSTKAMTGHTLGAAGAIEFALTTLMLRLGKTAPSHRCSKPSDEIAMLPDPEPVQVPGNAALSTSLAFGGSNTALIIRKQMAEEPVSSGEVSGTPLFFSSAAALQAGEPTPQKMLEICRKYGLRRLDRITQLSLAAADAVADAIHSSAVALITVTSYGPAVTTCKVLDDILDYPEEEILPTGFSHSVLNAAASYIGTCLKIHGPTFAIAGFEDPFREAVELAQSLLAGNRCEQVLIVAADEEGVISRASEKLRTGKAPAFTEGAFALVLSAQKDNGRELILDDAVTDERFLSCGIPADFTAQAVSQAEHVLLKRLAKPVWNASL